MSHDQNSFIAIPLPDEAGPVSITPIKNPTIPDDLKESLPPNPEQAIQITLNKPDLPPSTQSTLLTVFNGASPPMAYLDSDFDQQKDSNAFYTLLLKYYGDYYDMTQEEIAALDNMQEDDDNRIYYANTLDKVVDFIHYLYSPDFGRDYSTYMLFKNNPSFLNNKRPEPQFIKYYSAIFGENSFGAKILSKADIPEMYQNLIEPHYALAFYYDHHHISQNISESLSEMSLTIFDGDFSDPPRPALLNFNFIDEDYLDEDYIEAFFAALVESVDTLYTQDGDEPLSDTEKWCDSSEATCSILIDENTAETLLKTIQSIDFKFKVSQAYHAQPDSFAPIP